MSDGTRRWALGAALALAAGAGRAAAGEGAEATTVSSLAAQVEAGGADTSRAVEALRARGQEGLDALIVLCRRAEAGEDDEKTARLRDAVDAVAAQRLAHLSGLFWHTDLDAARAEAVRSGRPIFSLRLLGRLDEDCSCANSRLFRATLYANAEVSRALREGFVLHWLSLRPVPKVTVDFGDGRRLERTVTGNSVHYVLDAEGRVLDAVPGLYGPAAFLRAIEGAEALREALEAAGPGRPAALRAHHAARLEALRAAWEADASRLALGARLGAGVGVADDDAWRAIAQMHAPSARLDRSSVEGLRSRLPDAAEAGRLAMTKRVVEDPLVRLVRSLERSIAEDTVRSEYGLRRRVHEWFAAGETGDDVERLNRRVYAELFLSPLDDPWLGLVPADAYAALEAEGLR